jgi:hypothetical protein
MSNKISSQGNDINPMIEKILDELATNSINTPEKVEYWDEIKEQFVSKIISPIEALAAIHKSSSFEITILGFELTREE